MGYVFTFNDVKVYENWYGSPANQAVQQRELRLMTALLSPLPGRSLLDVGCGIGGCLAASKNQGLTVTGIDPSPYMLDAARIALGDKADLHRGVAEDLPFDDNAFHYVSIFKTLEFVDDPKKAVAEACRVAKDRVFIGVMTRHAIKKTRRQLAKAHEASFIEKARPVSIREIKQTVNELLGEVPVTWRSLCDLPIGSGKIAGCIERSFLLQRCPLGHFSGMVITPIPRFRTRPLSVTCAASPRPGGVVG